MERALHEMMVKHRGTVDKRVDAVARAICQSRSFEGVRCCQWPSQQSRKSDCPVDRGGFDDAAVAAIAACSEMGKEKLGATVTLADHADARMGR